jgi:hypothetical protein
MSQDAGTSTDVPVDLHAISLRELRDESLRPILARELARVTKEAETSVQAIAGFQSRLRKHPPSDVGGPAGTGTGAAVTGEE